MSRSRTAIRAARLFAVLGAAAFVVSLGLGVWLDRRLDRSIRDAPLAAAPLAPLVANVLLFSLFALHHSVLARTGVRRWLTRRVPPALERSLYVWTSSVLFAAVCLLWDPVPARLYGVGGAWSWAFTLARAVGIGLTLDAAARIDPRELAGLRQAWRFGEEDAAPAPPAEEAPPLVARGGYRLVRHPIYLGWILMVFGTPAMSAGRLAFALTSSLYLLLAIPFEERSLRERFGAGYDAYRRQVRWRVIPGVY